MNNFLNHIRGGGHDCSFLESSWLCRFALASLLVLAIGQLASSRWKKGQPPRGDVNEIPWVPYLLPILGSATSFRRDPLNFLRLWSERLDTDAFAALIGGRTYVFVADPHAAEQILGGRYPYLSFRPTKFMLYRNAGGMFDDGQAGVVSENRAYHGVLEGMLVGGLGDILLRYQLALRGAVLPDLAAPSAADAGAGGGGWARRSLMDAFGGSVWRASLLSLHGFPSMARLDDFRLALRVDGGLTRLLFTSRRSLQRLLYPEAYRAREEMVRRVGAALDAREADGDVSPYLSGLLSLFRDKLSRDNLCRHQLLNVLVATTFNTVPTAFWVAYHLLANPPAYRAVEGEVLSLYRERLGAAGSGGSPRDWGWGGEEEDCFSLSDLDRMANLDSIITETLRLKTTSLIFRGRTALADCDLRLPLDGTTKTLPIKRGWMVLTCPTLLHRDGDVFRDPDAFVWDRFLPGPDGSPPSFSVGGRDLQRPVEAFGAGPTMCPGRKLARAEIKAVVASMMLRFEMRFPGGEVPVPPATKGSTPLSDSGMPVCDVEFEVRERSEPW